MITEKDELYFRATYTPLYCWGDNYAQDILFEN